MLNRSSIHALAAVALVAAAALAPTGASAHQPMGVVIKKPVQGLVIQPHPVMGVALHPVIGVALHPVHPVLGVVISRPDPPHFWWHHHHEPVMIEEGETTREITRASAPVASVPTAPCNCLTKAYLQDGSVLFKDLCTKEAALASPDELRAQAQGTGPQVH
jgi:hypothetical protein